MPDYPPEAVERGAEAITEMLPGEHPVSDGFVRGSIYEDRYGTLYLCRREDGVLTELAENGPMEADEPTRLVGMTLSYPWHDLDIAEENEGA